MTAIPDHGFVSKAPAPAPASEDRPWNTPLPSPSISVDKGLGRHFSPTGPAPGCPDGQPPGSPHPADAVSTSFLQPQTTHLCAACLPQPRTPLPLTLCPEPACYAGQAFRNTATHPRFIIPLLSWETHPTPRPAHPPSQEAVQSPEGWGGEPACQGTGRMPPVGSPLLPGWLSSHGNSVVPKDWTCWGKQ